MLKCKCIKSFENSSWDGIFFKPEKYNLYLYDYSILKEDRGHGDYAEIEYYTIYTIEGSFIITTTYEVFSNHFIDLFQWRKEKIKTILCKS